MQQLINATAFWGIIALVCVFPTLIDCILL